MEKEQKILNKIHSLIDKVYHSTNLEMAWNQVRQNNGAGGIDNVTIMSFENKSQENLKNLRDELKSGKYIPLPVKRVYIDKRGKVGEKRPLGIPTIRDRVCQQALKNRLEPIFEIYFNDCSFGYRPNRSTHMAMRKIWRDINDGNQWIVDADLRDYFGTVNHELLINLIARKISDGKILKLIRSMLTAGYMEKGNLFPTNKGTPQGSVISPLLSNIYLTPFDNIMTQKGYKLTRFADDWLIVCKSREEAEQALKLARQVLARLGLEIHLSKTRITHVKWGFEFLGYKIKQGIGLKLNANNIKSKINKYNLYAYPKDKSIKRFMEEIRQRTKRKLPLTMKELIDNINPVIRGWGNYYRKAHVRKVFNKLDRWIIRRLWNHRFRRWRNCGWKKYPVHELYQKYGLINLIGLIPSIQ
jgi:group II intron reverse transcriptase/maturase